jgi:sulfite reductase (ferredoxin)
MSKVNHVEEIKKVKAPYQVLQDIHRYAKTGFDSIHPDDLDLFKWYGLYPQRPQEDGFFMLRVKIPGGHYSSEQMRVVAGIAKDFGRELLDVTDRQAFQYHWLKVEDVPEIFGRLEKVGLHSVGACGDTIRTVLSCPLAGVLKDELLDTRELVNEIHDHFSGNPEFGDLPRKFKISITACPEQCAAHQINDIGFVAHEVNGRVGFDVWVGGGLGAIAHLAERLGVFVTPDKVLEVARAITGAYRDHGYRVSRKKARLKFLIKDWGVEKFRQVVEDEYLNYKLEDGPAAPPAPRAASDHLGVIEQKDGRYVIGLATTVGRIDTAKALEIARIADAYGSGEIRNTVRQNIVLVNIPEENLESAKAELEVLGLYADSFFRGSTIACTGMQFCRLALTETKAKTTNLVEHLEAKFGNSFPHAFSINLTGCSNACARYQVADLGYMGSLRGTEEAYQVFIAGGLDGGHRLGDKLKTVVLAKDLERYNEVVIERFLKERSGNETWREFVLRLGVSQFEPERVLESSVVLS